MHLLLGSWGSRNSRFILGMRLRNRDTGSLAKYLHPLNIGRRTQTSKGGPVTQEREPRLTPEVVQKLRDRIAALSELGCLWGEAEPPNLDLCDAITDRLTHNYPYGDARYAGQILKPPHPVAFAAYATTMLLNPNNHALDGGPATAAMEREAVAAIADMFEMRTFLGHLTSSGTIANLEALWVGREQRPGQAVLYGANAHYTHERMCRLLGVTGDSIPQDVHGRMNLAALDARLAAGGVGTVIATLGTTALGALDQTHAIAELCARHDARLHIDAAYGGFHKLLADGEQPGVEAAPYSALSAAESIVVDPHKHGLQPYGCGCVIFKDPSVARLYAHESPYTYFSSDELHLGEISLECSRAGAAAAALWATLTAVPLTRQGLGDFLAGGRAAALHVAELIEEHPAIALAVQPELDIVCPFLKCDTTSQVSEASNLAFASLARVGWHVAKLKVSSEWLCTIHPGIRLNSKSTVILRSCFMKPEHASLADSYVEALRTAFSLIDRKSTRHAKRK